MSCNGAVVIFGVGVLVCYIVIRVFCGSGFGGCGFCVMLRSCSDFFLGFVSYCRDHPRVL